MVQPPFRAPTPLNRLYPIPTYSAQAEGKARLQQVLLGRVEINTVELVAARFPLHH